MSEEKYYKIKRVDGQSRTTWLSAAGIARVFDEGQETFIVSEIELPTCLHNGNFKLMGPAPASEIPPQPTSAGATPLESKEEPVVKTEAKTEAPVSKPEGE